MVIYSPWFQAFVDLKKNVIFIISFLLSNNWDLSEAFGSWGEGPFIFSKFGSTRKYFTGAGKLAVTYGSLKSRQ